MQISKSFLVFFSAPLRLCARLLLEWQPILTMRIPELDHAGGYMLGAGSLMGTGIPARVAGFQGLTLE